MHNQPMGIANRQLPLLLFIAALAIRLYRLAENPLWLDEFIVHYLGMQGLASILTHSSVGPHPPLYYLLQWISAGLGFFNTEWSWRWLSVISGALTIPLLYKLAARTASKQSALISSLLLLLAPTHLFFSQEARPYAFITLLSTSSIFLLLRIETSPHRLRNWIGFILFSIFGLYSSYSYAAIIGAHGLYFLLFFPPLRRYVLVAGGIIALSALPLLVSAQQPINHIIVRYASTTPLSPMSAAQYLLVIDTLRYGTYWGHLWIPLLFGIPILLTLWSNRNFCNRLASYCFLQIGLPLIFVFVFLLYFWDTRLPLKDAKQFMVLMPSIFILFALGLDRLRQIQPATVGKMTVFALCITILLSNLTGLQRYWTISKSPEGVLARSVRSEAQAGDGIVVLHYSVAAATDFYTPKVPAYSIPLQSDEDEMALFSRAGTMDETVAISVLVARHSRIWLLRHKDMNENIYNKLTEECSVRHEWVQPPFQSVLFDCAPPLSPSQAAR